MATHDVYPELTVLAYAERLINRVRACGLALALGYMAWRHPAWLSEGPLLWLFAVCGSYATIVSYLGYRGQIGRAMRYVSPCIDIGLLTIGCALSGGLASELKYFFLVGPFANAMRVGPRWTMGFTALAAACYVGIGLPSGLSDEEVRQLGLFPPVQLLLGYTAAMLSSRVLRSQDALERRVAARTEELSTANEQLRALDRLKQEFVGNVSHELRTPLTSIRGYAEFLEDEVGGPLAPTQVTFVGHIQDGARRLQRLVDDLLDFARLEAGTFRLQEREADMRAVVARALDSVHPQAASAGVRLEVDLPVTFGRLQMDPERIEQVVLNLVGNAIKFTPEGGRVLVSLRKLDGVARVQVNDSGIGIEAEALPRLFDKFFQVDTSSTRAYGGAGLGLAICKAIVEAHGGTIGATSVAGQGSTFTFTVPLARPAVVPEAIATTP